MWLQWGALLIGAGGASEIVRALVTVLRGDRRSLREDVTRYYGLLLECYDGRTECERRCAACEARLAAREAGGPR